MRDNSYPLHQNQDQQPEISLYAQWATLKARYDCGRRAASSVRNHPRNGNRARLACAPAEAVVKRYSIIAEEYGGSKYELAEVDANPGAVIKAARLKKLRLYHLHRSGEKTYRALLVRDNVTQEWVKP
jgi:hypothetical protein